MADNNPSSRPQVANGGPIGDARNQDRQPSMGSSSPAHSDTTAATAHTRASSLAQQSTNGSQSTVSEDSQGKPNKDASEDTTLRGVSILPEDNSSSSNTDTTNSNKGKEPERSSNISSTNLDHIHGQQSSTFPSERGPSTYNMPRNPFGTYPSGQARTFSTGFRDPQPLFPGSRRIPLLPLYPRNISPSAFDLAVHNTCTSRPFGTENPSACANGETSGGAHLGAQLLKGAAALAIPGLATPSRRPPLTTEVICPQPPFSSQHLNPIGPGGETSTPGSSSAASIRPVPAPNSPATAPPYHRDREQEQDQDQSQPPSLISDTPTWTSTNSLPSNPFISYNHPAPGPGPRTTSSSTRSHSSNIFRPMGDTLFPSSPDSYTLICNGFSPNYRGNPFLSRNQSAPIPPEKNCSLFITGLAPDLTTHALLASIRGAGRIYATHINGPEPDRGHDTCAAKVVFFERAAAERFYERHRLTGFVVVPEAGTRPGYVGRVVWNRIRSAETDAGGRKSRVLLISGPPAFVNREALTLYFASKIQFQVDEVRTLRHAAAVAAARGVSVVVPSVSGGSGGNTIVTEGSGQQHGLLPLEDRALVEYRFGSYRCQAEAARMALSREFKELGVYCEFGHDPCDGPDDFTPCDFWQRASKFYSSPHVFPNF
ncbi:hypothetical protein QBC47DRAFT_413616 [Echria macrotheca]|uniref:Uncharacterized protein n=1 Tax=Echria macrotheca TaxID=438768 RepID=A0AAJ0BEZ3_9PEZI|nr:hypothetical protein QBC47DRAFT_413616 [Echria macrotheca]